MSNVPPGPNLRGAIDLSALVQRAARPASPGRVAPTTDEDAASPASETRAPSPFVVRSDDASFPSLIELSQTVPVLVEFIAQGMEPALAEIVASYGGRVLLAVVDAQQNPQLAGAFQLREIPATAAVIAGRPMSLFVGDLPADQLGQLLEELLQVAAQNGVSGQLPADPAAPGASAAPVEPAEPPLPPLHQEAYDAISEGDYARAIDAYRRALRESPRDTLAQAGLAQVSLLQRLEGAEAGTIRDAAAAAPESLAAQLAVADLDMSGGHLEDAFNRLLELFPSLDADGKSAVQARLIEYFEIAGAEDERVGPARRRLASLLY